MDLSIELFIAHIAHMSVCMRSLPFTYFTLPLSINDRYVRRAEREISNCKDHGTKGEKRHVSITNRPARPPSTRSLTFPRLFNSLWPLRNGNIFSGSELNNFAMKHDFCIFLTCAFWPAHSFWTLLRFGFCFFTCGTENTIFCCFCCVLLELACYCLCSRLVCLFVSRLLHNCILDKVHTKNYYTFASKYTEYSGSCLFGGGVEFKGSMKLRAASNNKHKLN